MTQLTLYRANGSCSFVIHNLFLELNIPFTPVLMTFDPVIGYSATDGSLSHAAYKATVHPSGYVPALVLSSASHSETIAEVPALLTYIAALRPQRNLLGTSAPQRARVAQWLTYISGVLHGMGVAMVWRPGRFSDDTAAHAGIVKKGFQVLEEAFGRIEARFAEGEFLAGESETAADYYVFVFWRMGLLAGLNMYDKFPSFGRMVERMEGKDSVRATLAAEGLTPSFPRPQ
ncbi:hypothetical protein S7711_02675 [Stachybotrys chartarum IBT 7711]|uniref:GST C-terminal domain-containing protein n=1 Tax=Stachybotrys chartarum (strain CBS 109288 / IBT 7711) TaxID=1280523 RepID=A0A084AYX9_STACB|nr:hypothetical protein S7711_02675 [Stachybotrys chartarum IBT 7711]KFA54364.1 hypothetical protein S40293_04346 [Stachybotrys chartarum IBT 40293]